MAKLIDKIHKIKYKYKKSLARKKELKHQKKN